MILENPLVLGGVVFGLMWVIKKFNWAPDGLSSLWLTMGASLVLGIAEVVLSGQLGTLPSCAVCGDPLTVISCLAASLGAFAAMAGQVFIASQAIYQTLRHTIAQKVL